MRPPRLGEWWLARRIWPDEREAVLGDFSEEFREQVAATGRLRATWWYWRAAVRLTWGLRARESGVRWGRGSLMAFDDVRHAVRRLRRQPIGSVVSVVTLALGIGAAAATWSLVSAVVLNPLQVEEPERLVRIGLERESSRGTVVDETYTYQKLPVLRATGVFPALAAWGRMDGPTPMVVDTGAITREARAHFVSHNFFHVLGVPLTLGRSFTPQDDRRGAPPVAILSDRAWSRDWGADPAVIGRTMKVRDAVVHVVGVAPRGFRGLSLVEAPDLYMPLHTVDQAQPFGNPFEESVEATGWSPFSWVRLVGRLPDGESTRQIEQRLNGLVLQDFPTGAFRLTDVATAAIPTAARTDVIEFSRLLAVTVGLVLATGCLTVGTLLLIRTEARGDEFALCLALGASRRRLWLGVASESALLALAGAVLALPIGQGLFAGVRLFDLPGGISLDLLDLALDGRVVAAVGVAAAVSTVLMSAVASAIGCRTRPADVLRSRSGGTPQLTGRWPRAMLVVAQVSIAVVLATGTGLFARSVVEALTLNSGFPTDRLLTGALYLDAQGYDVPRAESFFADLRARLDVSPHVEAIGYSYSMGSAGGGYGLEIDGEPRELPAEMSYVGVDEHYFGVLGLPVTQGRDFSAADRAGAPLVCIVSESMARVVSSDGNAIGHRIQEFSTPLGQPRETIEIVGVVPDIITRLRSLDPLVLYRPIAQQRANPRRVIAIRAASDAGGAMAEVMAAVQALDPAVRPRGLSTMDDQMLGQMGPQQFGMTVMGTLGGIAILLTLLGAYVLAESLASTRRREMGIRAALGARGGHLRGLILSETARLVGVGLAVGLVLVWLGSGAIRSLLFQVEPLDPLVLGGVAASIALPTLAVSLMPAISALRFDLARLLREE